MFPFFCSQAKSTALYYEAKIYEEVKKLVGDSKYFLRFYGRTHVNGKPTLVLERAAMVRRLVRHRRGSCGYLQN